MSLASQRRVILAAFTNALAAELPRTAVHAWFPGKDMSDDCAWLGVPDGDVELPVVAGGPVLYRDDVFRFDLIVRVHVPGAAPDTIAELITERVNAAETVLVDGKATGWAPESIITVLPLRLVGPGIEPHANNEGWLGYAGFTIEVHSRLS